MNWCAGGWLLAAWLLIGALIDREIRSPKP